MTTDGYLLNRKNNLLVVPKIAAQGNDCLRNEGTTMKMSIEQQEYNNFLKQWNDPSWHRNLRFGQAFYNYFNLFKMKQTPGLEMLYNLDGWKAEKMIRELFDVQ